AGLVGALQEGEQRRSRISRIANDLVGQTSKRARPQPGPERLLWPQGSLAETCGLRRRVRVVARLSDLVVSGPEAAGDHLVRIGLRGERARVRLRGRAPPAETGDGEIQRVPEEMHRTGLAAEPAGELLEDTVCPVEDAPEALDRVSIVGVVLP